MSKPQAGRQGPLNPVAEKDSVVVEDPPNEPLVLSALEADLSAIRLLDAAADARVNAAKGERSDT